MGCCGQQADGDVFFHFGKMGDGNVEGGREAEEQGARVSGVGFKTKEEEKDGVEDCEALAEAELGKGRGDGRVDC